MKHGSRCVRFSNLVRNQFRLDFSDLGPDSWFRIGTRYSDKDEKFRTVLVSRFFFARRNIASEWNFEPKILANLWTERYYPIPINTAVILSNGPKNSMFPEPGRGLYSWNSKKTRTNIFESQARISIFWGFSP